MVILAIQALDEMSDICRLGEMDNDPEILANSR